jgi:hypothetical protein
MNLISFTHYGESVNCYFNLIGDDICDIKVTRGAHKDEGFDLSQNDVEMIADEISFHLYSTTREFEALNKTFDA